MKRVALAFILLLSVLVTQPRLATSTPVALSVEGPTALTPGQVGIYFVNVTGGPGSVNGTYSIKYWIEAADTTGAQPLSGNPGSASSSQNNSFKVNLTAPSHEGGINLVVEATSHNSTANASTRRTITIEVLAPLIMTAAFANNGGAAAVNTTVSFYVDDRLAGKKVISRINPGDRGTATLNWIPVGVSAGQHTVRVEADIDHNGIIEPNKGEVVSYDTFYKSGGELAPGYLLILSLAIILIGIVLIIVYRRRARSR